ncbi:MAG: HEAT repeat domain-containing protein, partial [Myxococcota bacterium]|nr:HEAT repeat domain-containing protein [Myxococcota bacterium]
AALVALRTLGAGRPVAPPPAREDELEELLVDALGHPDEEVVKEGLRVVADHPMARKESKLAIGLSHPAWDVRRLAATLLGALGSEEARAKLRERAAIESDDLVRIAIVDALGAVIGGAGA